MVYFNILTNFKSTLFGNDRNAFKLKIASTYYNVKTSIERTDNIVYNLQVVQLATKYNFITEEK